MSDVRSVRLHFREWPLFVSRLPSSTAVLCAGSTPAPTSACMRAHAIDLINNPFLILTHHSTPLFFLTISLTPFLHTYINITGLFMWASLLPIYLIHYSFYFYITISYSVCYLDEIISIWRIITTVHKSGLKNRFKWLFIPTIVCLSLSHLKWTNKVFISS